MKHWLINWVLRKSIN